MERTPFSYNQFMQDSGDFGPATTLSIGSAFPALSCDLLGLGVNSDAPLLFVRPFPDEVSELLLSEFLSERAPRLARLFPVLLERRNDLLGRDELERFGRRGATQLIRTGCVNWMSVLELTAHVLREEIHSSENDIARLVRLLVELTFESAPALTASGRLPTPVRRPGAWVEPQVSPSDPPAIAWDRTFREVFPPLVALPFAVVPHDLLPYRVYFQLATHDWQPFLDNTPERILELRGVDQQAVEEVWARLSLLARSSSAVLLRYMPGRTRESRQLKQVRLSPIVDWAMLERDAATLGDILELKLDDPPRTLVEEWNRVSSAVLHVPEESVANQQLTEILLRSPEMARTAIAMRHSPNADQATLEDVGEVFGVTRERIRQQESRMVASFGHMLEDPALWQLAARVAEFRRRLGPVCFRDSQRCREVLEWVARGVPEGLREAALGLVARVAGPYKWEGNWLVRADWRPDGAGSLLRQTFAGGPASLDVLAQRAAELGLHRDQLERLLADGEQVFEHHGLLYRRSTPLGDLACEYLRHAGRPLSTDDLVELLVHRAANAHSARNALSLEPRIHRTKKTEWALVEWGLPEYTSVHELMLSEIAESGGVIHIDALADRLKERFGIPAASVNMIAGRPLFFVADGFVRARTTEPYEGSFICPKGIGMKETSDDGLVWRLPVDGDILRGSGRRAPEFLLLRLGVGPGESGAFEVSEGRFKLAWPPAGNPSISSVRELVQALGGKHGDTLVLAFTEAGEADASLVRQEDVLSDPVTSVAQMLGASPAAIEADPLEALAIELNVVAGGRRSKLRRCQAVLDELEESDLADLLRAVEV
jgi:hypothetical protein